MPTACGFGLAPFTLAGEEGTVVLFSEPLNHAVVRFLALRPWESGDAEPLSAGYGFDSRLAYQ
jgi:hypothetical protein